MIAHLTGMAKRTRPGEVILDVHGVGYGVTVPLDVWEQLEEERPTTLHIYSYVKEDRFDLFGFETLSSRTLFAELMKISGIGPSLGLELCGVPRSLLLQAIQEEDPGILTNIKGIGKKKAEKVLLDLKSLMDNQPAMFAGSNVTAKLKAHYDQDAVAALAQLGYDQATIATALKAVPAEATTTEERVAAALKVL